jgi:hypothetical protein
MRKRPRKIEAAGIDGSYLKGVPVPIQSIKKYKIIWRLFMEQKINK